VGISAELSRLDDDLRDEFRRLSNQFREQWRRFFHSNSAKVS
jgi:hypothetical protein